MPDTCRNCGGPSDHFGGSQFDPHPTCESAHPLLGALAAMESEAPEYWHQGLNYSRLCAIRDQLRANLEYRKRLVDAVSAFFALPWDANSARVNDARDKVFRQALVYVESVTQSAGHADGSE